MLICLLAYLVNQEAAIGLHGDVCFAFFEFYRGNSSASDATLLVCLISELLGERITHEMSKEIKHVIRSVDGVKGVYDLVVHNYGSESLIGSAHIEVDDTMNAVQIDRIEREIAKKVFIEKGISMTGISIYSSNTNDEAAKEAHLKIRELIKDYPDVLSTHGFYMNSETKEIRFDLVLNIEAKNKFETYAAVLKRARELYPDYDVDIQIDYNFSD